MRYNNSYPRWAYDQYRQIMFDEAINEQRAFIDLWDVIGQEYFIDDIFHLSPEGERLMAEVLAPDLQEMICGH